MKRRIFAGNWKMHLGPEEAREFVRAFLSRYHHQPDREVWLFPAAVALETVASAVAGRPGMLVGAQNIHWEDKGAFTGEMSVPMARSAGARASLVGHSERRHVFGETDAETAKKLRALLKHGCTPVLCVGEKLEERERNDTLAVVNRQLGALNGLDPDQLSKVVIAYEPVWAIGTGRNATPRDAAEVHASIRAWFKAQAASLATVPVLYGGSVKLDNVKALMAEKEIDGVLVGGASLDPVGWGQIVDG